MTNYAIVRGKREYGMGCHLEPPGHPSYTAHVSEGTGEMSLDCALTSALVHESVRVEIRAMLDAYVPPPVTSPSVRRWIAEVLAYYKGCYRNAAAGDRQWYAGYMIIANARSVNPMEHVDNHAGVNFVRKYYPDWAPTKEDFK